MTRQSKPTRRRLLLHTGMLADLNIPKALMSALGHSDCGIYAEVTAAGEIAAGNEIEMV
jgi:hypothetical protein